MPKEVKQLSTAKQLKALGFLQIFFGIILALSGILQSIFEGTIYNSYGFVPICASIWGGGLVLVSGSLAAAAADNPHKCHTIGGLAMASFSILTTLTMLAFEIVGLEVDHFGQVYYRYCDTSSSGYPYNCYDVPRDGVMTGLMLLHGASVLFAVASFCCTVSQIVYLSKEVCCQKTDNAVSAVEMQPHNMQVFPVATVQQEHPHPSPVYQTQGQQPQFVQLQPGLIATLIPPQQILTSPVRHQQIPVPSVVDRNIPNLHGITNQNYITPEEENINQTEDEHEVEKKFRT